MKGARVGLIGARPTNFNTVRFSEKLLEHAGISVETLDLSEVFGRIEKLPDDHQKVTEKLSKIRAYIPTKNVPSGSILRMAKFGAVVDSWMEAQQLVGSAVQCWTAMEAYYGIVPCTLMSMMSNELLPSACETDIAGLVGMLSMVLASGKPSAIVDWNNNFGDDPNKGVIFHCSNLPKDIFVDEKIAKEKIAVMDYQEIIAGSVGKENTYGAVVGRSPCRTLHLLPCLNR